MHRGLTRLAFGFLALFLGLLACGASAASGAGGAQAAGRTILVFGDSLSAGYGIRQDAAWPALLGRRLSREARDYTVVNASISGETTAGGKARLKEVLIKHKPAILVLALGANDGLRGLPVKTMQQNLTTMVKLAKSRGVRVLLVGMRLPPNYGPYADQFQAVFREVAAATHTPLVPFLLDGVAEHPGQFQADNLHPTADAQPRLLDNVWPALLPILKGA